MEVRCAARNVGYLCAMDRRVGRRGGGSHVFGMLVLLAAATARAAAPTDLAIHMTATSFRVGVDGVYHLSVSNVGDVNTDAPVRVTSTLPAGLTFVSGGGAGFTCSGSGRSVECTVDGVAAQSTLAFTVTVDICTTEASVTTAFSVVYAGDTSSANDTAQRVTSVKAGQCSIRAATPTLPPGVPTRTPTAAGAATSTQTPTPVLTDLQLTTTSAGSFTIGTQPNYFNVVTNVGTDATNVPLTFVDTLPKGVGFVDVQGDGWTCAVSGRTVTCTNPNSLDVGATTALTLTVIIGTDAYPSVTNVATVIYAADIDEANNTARRPTTIRRPRPARPGLRTHTPAPARTPPATATASPRPVTPTDLLLIKTSRGVFNVGRPGLYVLKVANVGPFATEAPITLTDTLPDSLGFIAASGSGWSCTVSGQRVTCSNPNPLQPGAATILNLSVNVTADAFPTVVNTAAVTYANDTNPGNNTARRPTTVRR